jgi:holo-[acyl-carrier protein] synthase
MADHRRKAQDEGRHGARQYREPLRRFTGADREVAVVTVVAGLDVQRFDEVADSFSRFGERYLRRIYSEREIAECLENHHTMVASLALRFAAKEAVLKALTPQDHIPPWRSIEVLFHSRSTPTVELHGEAQHLARQRGVDTILLSVSLGCDYAVAAACGDVAATDATTGAPAETR